MIKISITGLDKAQAMLRGAEKQINYAASRAINSTAFDAMREGRAHIAAGIKASPWTVNAWYVRKKASKNNLTASVGWSDYLANKRGHAAEYYLSQHWTGGSRKQKAFESRLQRAGLLPAGMVTVPGKAASDLRLTDGKGNIKGSSLVSILSGLGAFTESGYNANASGRKPSKSKAASRHVYWAGKPGPNTPNGIWVIDEKYKSGRGRLRPVMIFVNRASYQKRLDLGRAVEKARRNMDKYFSDELNNALMNAK